MKADVVVYDKNGQLAAVIEAKNIKGKPRKWAIEMRRNLYEYGFLPKIPYFILALPDRLYIWKNAKNTPEIIEPDYEIDITELFKSYYDQLGISPEEIGHDGFELLITSWLNEIAQADIAQTQNLLVNSGLLETLKTGRIVSEAEI
jgi:hypothetical protein